MGDLLVTKSSCNTHGITLQGAACVPMYLTRRCVGQNFSVRGFLTTYRYRYIVGASNVILFQCLSNRTSPQSAIRCKSSSRSNAKRSRVNTRWLEAGTTHA